MIKSRISYPILAIALWMLLAPLVAFAENSVMDFTFDSSVPEEVEAQITASLDYIYQIELSRTSQLHKEMFGEGLTGEVYIKQLKSIKTIAYDANPSSTAIAYVSHFPNPGTATFTKNVLKRNLGLAGYLDTLLHEARHLNPKDASFQWFHHTCPMYALNGKPILSKIDGNSLADKTACDMDLGGSYARSAVMLFNIARFCTNCSVEEKANAFEAAKTNLERVIGRRSHQAILEDWVISYFSWSD